MLRVHRHSRKIAAFRNTETGETARIYHDQNSNEYTIKLYYKSGIRAPFSDKHTQSRDAAYGAARKLLGETNVTEV